MTIFDAAVTIFALTFVVFTSLALCTYNRRPDSRLYFKVLIFPLLAELIILFLFCLSEDDPIEIVFVPALFLIPYILLVRALYRAPILSKWPGTLRFLAMGLASIPVTIIFALFGLIVLDAFNLFSLSD
jgi:hypothetical protein